MRLLSVAVFLSLFFAPSVLAQGHYDPFRGVDRFQQQLQRDREIQVLEQLQRDLRQLERQNQFDSFRRQQQDLDLFQKQQRPCGYYGWSC